MKSQLGANGVKQDISSTGKSRNPGGNTDAALTGRRRTDGHTPHLALHTQQNCRVWRCRQQGHARMQTVVGEERSQRGGKMSGVIVTEFCHRKESGPMLGRDM